MTESDYNTLQTVVNILRATRVKLHDAQDKQYIREISIAINFLERLLYDYEHKPSG